VDRWKQHFSFSHLYTGFDYAGIQEFVGLRNGDYPQAPIPPERTDNLGELCVWLFGSKSRDRPPVVQSQNPHLRQLNEVLLSDSATAALRSNLPLSIALDVRKGDEAVFREALVTAKAQLQKARGSLITGYKGEADLLDVGNDVVDLSETILDEMRRRRRGRPPRRMGDDE